MSYNKMWATQGLLKIQWDEAPEGDYIDLC